MRNEITGWRIAALLVLVCALVLDWYASACGLLLTSDSHQYLSAAASFKNSFQFLGSDGQPMTYWPPLFPFVLSLFTEPVADLPWVNGVIKVMLFFLLGSLAQTIISSEKIVLAYLIFIFCGVHLVLVSVFVWSELIFILLQTVFIWALLRHRRSHNFLLLAFLSGFLLCLQRNAGLFIVTGASIWMMVETPSVHGFLKSILLFFATTSGLWSWNIYASYFVASDFRVYAHDYGFHFFHNLRFLVESWGRAFAPLAGGIFFMVALLLIGFTLRVEFLRQSHLKLLALVCFVYLMGMSLLFKLDVHDGDRYIAVILPLFSLLAFSAIHVAGKASTRNAKIWHALVLVLALAYPIIRSVKNARQWHEMSCCRGIDLTSFSR